MDLTDKDSLKVNIADALNEQDIVKFTINTVVSAVCRACVCLIYTKPPGAREVGGPTGRCGVRSLSPRPALLPGPPAASAAPSRPAHGHAKPAASARACVPALARRRWIGSKSQSSRYGGQHNCSFALQLGTGRRRPCWPYRAAPILCGTQVAVLAQRRATPCRAAQPAGAGCRESESERACET